MQEECHSMAWLEKFDASVPFVPCSPPDRCSHISKVGSLAVFSYCLVLGMGKLPFVSYLSLPA